jgi:HlyD family secretion protein
MDEIDIQTKFAARVKDILVDEGAAVRPGQVLARMDVSDLTASLAAAQAAIAQAEANITQGQADLDQARASVPMMQREVARTESLLPRGFATQETLDRQRQELDAAQAMVRSAQAHIAAAAAARDAARQQAAFIAVNIADDTLVAPRAGLIQYRLANVGEVLPAGGKLYTLLDTHYAYMDVFLPSAQAGLAVPGREARVVLDARPGAPLPAHVTFLAEQNQFTPKMVETRTERDKLMFRVRVRIDDAALADGTTQAGMPGIAYIRADPTAPWPAVAAAAK